MNIALGEICSYRSEKANASNIGSEDLYISTESMVPNKGGISTASSIPETGRVSLFRQGDTLVSNIRPYFKKIWHADQNGYCSNDILVFRPNDAIASDYLYWLLSGNQFFDYVMATSKGTKMPRGDKSAIMNYAVPSNDETARRMIVSIMNPIQSKIEANTKLNGYLEELFATLFSELISSRNYSYVPLTDVIFFQEGPGIRNWQYVYDGGGVNFINIRCIQSHDLDLSNANQISVEEAYGKYDRFLVKPGDILMSSSGTLGRYAIARQEHLPLCMNTSVIRFRPLADSTAYAFVYGYLTSREFYNHLTGMANGSAQVNFGPTHLKKIEVPWPDEDTIRTFNKMTMPLIETMNALRSESNKLATLRDTLLPKLMSGEIDVSKVDLTQLNSHLAECIQVINQGAVEPNLSPNLANQPFAGKFFVCCSKSVFGSIELFSIPFFSQFFNSFFEWPVKLFAICLHRVQDNLVLINRKQKRLISVNELGDYRFRLTFEHESSFHRKGLHLIELQMKPQLMLAFKYMRDSGSNLLKKSRIGQQFKA